jgi:hypothetical protein
MAQAQASDCINQIDTAEKKIADYNANWNAWNIEYQRLQQEVIIKETEINNKDLELYNWMMSELQNNSRNNLIHGIYGGDRDGCGDWNNPSCADKCREFFIDGGIYTTPRGRRPLSINHHHTHREHCKWTLPIDQTWRCYCKIMTSGSENEFNSRAANINSLIGQKTTLQNTVSTHALNMPQFPPIIVKCCDKVIECNNKIYGPNSCYGNLQICKQSNINIIDKSIITELEKANKAKIINIKQSLVPITAQVKEILNTIYNLSIQVANLIDTNNLSRSISDIKDIYNKISLLITKIETIKNINNTVNEAKELFSYITADTTHRREMDSIFQTIRTDVNNIQNIIKQANNTFSNIKNIYETLLTEELNINLLKQEQNKILGSIYRLNENLDRLIVIYDTINSSKISSQEDINILLEMYDKAKILVNNINLEIDDIKNFRNELTNINNKFTINSFLINNVREIYNQSITKIENIFKRINEFRIDIIINKIYNIILENKNIYEINLLNLDEEKKLKIIKDEEKKLKIIKDEELNKIYDKIINKIDDKIINKIDDKIINKIDDKIINKTDNIIIKNDTKQEEPSGINITFIIIGIVIVIILIFIFYKK